MVLNKLTGQQFILRNKTKRNNFEEQHKEGQAAGSFFAKELYYRSLLGF